MEAFHWSPRDRILNGQVKINIQYLLENLVEYNQLVKTEEALGDKTIFAECKVYNPNTK